MTRRMNVCDSTFITFVEKNRIDDRIRGRKPSYLVKEKPIIAVCIQL